MRLTSPDFCPRALIHCRVCVRENSGHGTETRNEIHSAVDIRHARYAHDASIKAKSAVWKIAYTRGVYIRLALCSTYYRPVTPVSSYVAFYAYRRCRCALRRALYETRVARRIRCNLFDSCDEYVALRTDAKQISDLKLEKFGTTDYSLPGLRIFRVRYSVYVYSVLVRKKKLFRISADIRFF